MTLPSADSERQPVLFNISRRTFFKRCAAVAAATGLPLWFVERQLSAAEAVDQKPSPNDRPGIALIGCGGMGKIDAALAANYGDIVAVCDVDANQAAGAVAKFTVDGKSPAQYSDFRRVLERKDVHAIVNVTPDHWHTLINIAAAKAKKDVYAEKPLTLSIDEGRHVIKAVRENKVVLQTGTQQRSMQRFVLACEAVRNGRIGQLKEATVWLPAGLHGGPFSPSAIPSGLDWDFWQGQAPAAEFVKERCHGTFRFWYEYSGGTMTDWGAHHNDIAYWAVGLIAPREVSSRAHTQPIPGGYTAYSDYEVNYVYENGVRLNIRTTRDDSIFGEVLNPAGQRNGIRFEGTEGWIWVNRHELEASDRARLRQPLPENAERLYTSRNHMRNFFECMRTRQDPVANVEIGHRSATMCHLGAISLRTGKKLNWDYKAERFVGENASEANGYLAREMRKPYDFSFI
jgi:predicted dehydrogenase